MHFFNKGNGKRLIVPLAVAIMQMVRDLRLWLKLMPSLSSIYTILPFSCFCKRWNICKFAQSCPKHWLLFSGLRALSKLSCLSLSLASCNQAFMLWFTALVSKLHGAKTLHWITLIGETQMVHLTGNYCSATGFCVRLVNYALILLLDSIISIVRMTPVLLVVIFHSFYYQYSGPCIPIWLWHCVMIMRWRYKQPVALYDFTVCIISNYNDIFFIIFLKLVEASNIVYRIMNIPLVH